MMLSRSFVGYYNHEWVRERRDPGRRVPWAPVGDPKPQGTIRAAVTTE